MRKFVLSLVMLWLTTSFAIAQPVTPTMIGGGPPEAKVNEARGTIAMAAPKTLTLPVQQFHVFVQAEDSPVTWYNLPGSKQGALQIVYYSANSKAKLYGRRLGEPEAKAHTLTFDKPFLIITGMSPGVFRSALFKNAVDPKVDGPTHTDDVTVTVVGDNTPPDIDPDKPDVPPPADELVDTIKSAYTLDKVSGVGNAAMLRKLAGVYAGLGSDSFAGLTSFNDVNNYIGQAITKQQIPSYTTALTKVRYAIQAEMLKAVNIRENDNDKALTPKDVEAIQKISKRLAAAMLSAADTVK